MNIACATDGKFVQHCGVMVTSLFANNPDEDITVYLLTPGLTVKEEESLKNICLYYRKKIIINKIGNEVLEGLPLFRGDHVSLAAYLRLFLPRILPENVDKILYLDGDIIVRGSLRELWATDISSYPLGAVEESTSYTGDNYQRLQYDSRFSYFNSGVLLLNLDFWRKNKSVEACFDYLNNYPDRVRWHDQDILNGVFHEHWLRLPVRWNALEGYFQTNFYLNTALSELLKANIRNELREAVVIHFCAKIKPWHPGNSHPLRKEYFKYLQNTEWKGWRVKGGYSGYYFKKILRDALCMLGVKKPLFIAVEK